MRLLGLLLCLAACTSDNPAFFASATDSGGGTTDSTRPGTGVTEPPGTGTEPPPTSATTGPDLTTTDDPDPSDSTTAVTTTDVPVTSTSTSTSTSTGPEPMTATSQPNDTDTGPNTCIGFADPLGPLVPLLSVPDHQQFTAAQCGDWQQMVFQGRFTADADGFEVVSDLDCMPANLPVDGLRFPVPLAVLPDVKNACVSLRFTAHQDSLDCYVSEVTVNYQNKPLLWGSFGVDTFAKGPIEVTYNSEQLCDCKGCCFDAPDPDLYTFYVDGVGVLQGDSLMFSVDSEDYQFKSLRSHVHGDECQTNDISRADWLHFDWVAVQLP